MIKLIREGSTKYPWLLKIIMLVIAVTFTIGMGWFGYETAQQPNMVAVVVAEQGKELAAADHWAFADRGLPYFAGPRYLGFAPELPKAPSEEVGQRARILVRGPIPGVGDVVCNGEFQGASGGALPYTCRPPVATCPRTSRSATSPAWTT